MDMAVMQNFLVDDKDNKAYMASRSDVRQSNDVLAHAGAALMQAEVRSQSQQMSLNASIKDINAFGEVVGQVAAKEWEQAQNVHSYKVSVLRQQKKYERWLQEDEDDIEGEKVYSDIKNLVQEKYFNVYFDSLHDQTITQEQIKNQINLDSTLNK